MKTKTKVIIALCVVVAALFILFATWRFRINRLTERVEQAGGFIGSVQPPGWLKPVYGLVCRLEVFCEPYQIILDANDAIDEALRAAQELPRLRILELVDITISQETLLLIKTMDQLNRLEFRRCSSSPSALAALHMALAKVNIIEKK